MHELDVFIPCYNAERFLQQTIDSIKSQTFQDYRVLIIDDCSTDHTREIIQKYAKQDARVKVLYNEENHGECYTRNRALKESQAKYVAYIDADDLMAPNRLEIQMNYLRSHPECDIISGNYQVISEEGENGAVVSFGDCETENIYAAFFFEDIIANGTATIKREFVEKNNLWYDENFPSVGDYNFWVDCMCAGANMHIVNEVAMDYRVVQTGLSRMNSRPDKVKKRTECFNQVHGKILSYYKISLSNRQTKVYFKYATDVVKTKKEKLCDCVTFATMMHRMRRQVPFSKNTFDPYWIQFWKRFIFQ